MIQVILFLLLLAFSLSLTSFPNLAYPVPVLHLDLSNPSSPSSISLPYISQNDGAFMMSVYLRVSQIPPSNSGNTLDLFKNDGFSACVFGAAVECIQNYNPPFLYANHWLYLSLQIDGTMTKYSSIALFQSGGSHLANTVLSLAHLQIWNIADASATLANSLYLYQMKSGLSINQQNGIISSMQVSQSTADLLQWPSEEEIILTAAPLDLNFCLKMQSAFMYESSTVFSELASYGEVTLEFWMKNTGTTVGQVYRIVGLTQMVQFNFNSDRNGYNWMKHTTSLYFYSSFLNAEQWDHFAISWKSGVSVLNAFNEVHQEVATVHTLDSSSASFYLSNTNPSQSSFLTVFLLQVRVWKRALSFGTILYNMHTKINPRFAASLILYFPLNDKTINEIKDISVYASISLTASGASWGIYTDLELCQANLESETKLQNSQYIEGEGCTDAGKLIDLTSLATPLSITNNALDRHVSQGIGYRFWIYQTSYAAQQSLFIHMNNGLRLKMHTSGLKELILNNEAGSHNLESLWSLNQWTNVEIWFQINSNCELKLQTSLTRLKVESCNFVSTAGQLGNSISFGEAASNIYLAHFVIYSQHGGTHSFLATERRQI